jgi:hypothetical protein
LGGNLIASAACARESSEPGATTTRLDVVDEVLGVSTTAPAFWVYDGVRTWTVQKTLFLGRYHRYQNRDSDCVVYTNSASAEFLLAIFSVGGVPWYSAAEYSVPRLTLVE